MNVQYNENGTTKMIVPKTVGSFAIAQAGGDGPSVPIPPEIYLRILLAALTLYYRAILDNNKDRMRVFSCID